MTPTDTAPTGSSTVRDAVLELLRGFGMRRIFGNPGSTELPLFLDFPADFRYVLGLQESVVVGMADGYAQATRNAAFVNLHSAAGVGHAMGNIFTAHKNRTPIVITAGQQARSILPFDPFLFSAQATELPKPYVKWSCEPARAEDVPLAIARAYYVAMQPPRGPVLVSIPADDWARPCEPVAPRRVSRAPRPEPAVLARSASARRQRAAGLRRRRRRRPRRRLGRGARAGRAAPRPRVRGADVGALRLPGRPSAVRRLPAGDAREDRRRCWPARPHPGARRAGLHLPRRRPRPAPAGGRRAVPADRRPDIAAWAPVGTSAVGSMRLARAGPAARAAAARRGRCRRAGRRGRAPGPRSRCRWPTRCRRWPSCAGPSTSSSRRRRARGR